MSVKLKRDAQDKPAGRTTGISHVRFGKDGKIIFPPGTTSTARLSSTKKSRFSALKFVSIKKRM